MAFSAWISRLRSSSRPICTKLRNSFYDNRNAAPGSLSTEVFGSENFRKRFMSSWFGSLLPLALAISAGSIDFESHHNNRQSDCQAPNLDQTGKSIGGKGSTNYLVEGPYRKVPQELIEKLKAICKENMSVDNEERYFHGKPQHSFHRAVNIPDIIVHPMCEEEVSKIVAFCNEHKVPVVPYGGATSIEGHTLSPSGGVCIDMTLMNRVKSLNVRDMDVVVEPGIGWMELNEYLEPYGLFFPLDPGPGATIGGMCATRCSGSLAVRYGTMRENVINLKVVLPNGDVVKTGSRARKSAAGYDLTRLVIGSEGTLGVITEVTLRLQKIPQHSVVFPCYVAICNFPTIKDAADVAIATMLSGIQVSRVELLDEVQVRAINIANGKNLPEAPILMFEFIGTEAYLREQTLIVQKIDSEHNGTDFVFAEDPEAKNELWKVENPPDTRQVENPPDTRQVENPPDMRHVENPPDTRQVENPPHTRQVENPPHTRQVENPPDTRQVENSPDTRQVENSVEMRIRKEALWACFAMEPNSEAMITDVCVPLSRLAELISISKQELDSSSLVCTVIAHAGDGNFHTVILFDPNDDEKRKEAERLNHFMVHAALDMESGLLILFDTLGERAGTCTGEHGVGTGKMKYLEKELGMEALKTMKKIKAALDPNDIMNPGKLIPPHVCF
ncbi:hypothetical protein OROGR_023994 [Orobanche gracilis]